MIIDVIFPCFFSRLFFLSFHFPLTLLFILIFLIASLTSTFFLYFFFRCSLFLLFPLFPSLLSLSNPCTVWKPLLKQNKSNNHFLSFFVFFSYRTFISLFLPSSLSFFRLLPLQYSVFSMLFLIFLSMRKVANLILMIS